MARTLEPSANDSNAFDVSKLRLKPSKNKMREQAPDSKHHLSKQIKTAIADVRKNFEKISAIDSASEPFLDEAVSGFEEEASDDRNKDLEFLILDVQMLVENVLVAKNLSDLEKEGRFDEIQNIEGRMEDISSRYQSNERGLRGAVPDSRFGFLEPDVQKVFDGITRTLSDIKRLLG